MKKDGPIGFFYIVDLLGLWGFANFLPIITDSLKSRAAVLKELKNLSLQNSFNFGNGFSCANKSIGGFLPGE